MSYTTAVYDRTIIDIIAKNSKAYLNLADWQRIDGNTLFTIAELVNRLSASITPEVVATMTTASIPDVDDVNDLATNIEYIRAWIAANYPASDPATDPLFTEVKDDYTSPTDLTHSTYNHPFEIVNQWEKVVDLAYQWVITFDERRLLLETGDLLLLENEDTLLLG